MLLVIIVVCSIVHTTCTYGTESEIQKILKRLDAIERRLEEVEYENKMLREDNRQMMELHGKHTDNQFEHNNIHLNVNDARPNEPPIPGVNEDSTKPERHLEGKPGLSSKQNKKTKKRLLTGSTESPTPPPVTRVAFKAALSHELSSLGVHQAIEYDQVLLNDGKAYNPLHGHFIAPVKGVYLFSFSIIAYSSTSVALDIVKNGHALDILYAGSANSEWASQSKTFPLALDQGDMVWLRTLSGYHGRRLYGDVNYHHTSFSGVLLYQN